MKSYVLIRSLLLLLLVHWNPVIGLCHLEGSTAAECDVLEDARYINTYHLHSLRTRSNLTILSPGNFGNLTSLRHLDLSGGRIESIESGSFLKLKSLQTLNLGNNRLGHLEPDSFDGLKHLHSLRLQNNDIAQLPSALISLQELRLLDLSGNPLNCNCASLKLKDVLLERGVKISKKSKCILPTSAKLQPIIKQNTKKRCDYEDVFEMLSDQPMDDNSEASGNVEEDDDAFEELEKAFDEEEKDFASTSVSYDTETAASSSTTEESLSATASGTSDATQAMDSSSTTVKDNITFEDPQDSVKNETDATTTSVNETKTIEEDKSDEVFGVGDDIIVPVHVANEQSTTEEFIEVSSSPKPNTDDIIHSVEGSGETADDGSGMEGSGFIAGMPGIDFNSIVEEEEEAANTTSTSKPTTTANTNSVVNQFTDFLKNLNPFSNFYPTVTTTTTTESTITTEKNPEEALTEEQFIRVTDKSISVDAAVKPIVTHNALPEEVKKSSKSYEGENAILNSSDNFDDSSLDAAESQESKKGMGSYVVLATLLAILVILIAFAAYKGDFCRKKRKRRDAERGTELKDMQKSLLEQNAAQPKVQVANGHTLENVPLMNSSSPDDPKENQRSYDVNSNGSSKPNGTIVDDPIKPPRKSLNQEIEAPLNGLDPPMDDIDGPLSSSLYGDSNEILNSEDYTERPPRSPEAQRVKITVQENPDSVPKTPLVITRVDSGDNV